MGDAVDLVRDNVSHVLSRFQTSPMHFYLGFSGGVDSTSLLDAVCSYLKQHTQHQLSLIHINHGLHDDADAWEAHCAGVARQYRLPLSTHQVLIQAKHDGIENACRKARWAVFTSILSKKNHCLLLAHHANDQVETFFLRLMRGAGLSGLSSIREDCHISGIRVVRPLLSIDKTAILTYASVLSLPYISDLTNFDSVYDRNYIRNDIIPSLQARWPSAISQAIRSIGHIQADWDYLLNIASIHLDELITIRFGLPCIDQNRFNMLSQADRYLCLRAFILRKGWYLPSSKQMAMLVNQLESSRKGSTCTFQTNQFSLFVYASFVYLLPKDFFTRVPDAVKFDLKSDLYLPFHCPNPCRAVADWSALIGQSKNASGELIFGDRVIDLLGAKRYKKILQSRGVPLRIRRCYPFLILDHRCIPISFAAEDSVPGA